MSQSGEAVFYRTRPLDDPVGSLRSLVAIIRPCAITSVSRSLVEDRGWEDFRNDGPGIADEILPRPARPEDWAALYKKTKSLRCSMEDSPLARRMQTAVEASIPPAIRGNYLPTDTFVTAGFHDLWENAEHEEGFLFARAFLSIRFFGYGTPSHWKAFRAMVFDIPEVQAVKRELEAVTGPLEQCVFWSV